MARALARAVSKRMGSQINDPSPPTCHSACRSNGCLPLVSAASSHRPLLRLASFTLFGTDVGIVHPLYSDFPPVKVVSLCVFFFFFS